ncbi:MAG: Holliday junction resolvase RuvX [Chitinophagaceae bacterium]
MARLLALDIGKKRCGIAVSDPLQIIANGLTTVDSKDLISFLKKYFEQENIEKVIVGMPKNLKNEDTHGTSIVNEFLEKFKTHFPQMPIITIDERFTSKLAFQSMIDNGMKKKDRQNKALVDEISATIILKDFMETL